MLTEILGNLYGINDTMTEYNLENFPQFMQFEFFYEFNLKFVEEIIENPYFNCIIGMFMQTFDLSVIFSSVKLGTFSIVPNFLDVYVAKTHDLFNQRIGRIYMILFLLGSAIFVVGILAIAWLIYMILKVKKVIQFSLSMFSMVDPTYVQEMQNIMNLFHGKTSGIIQTNNDLQRIFNEVESLVPECPLELDNQMHITSISNKLIDMWGLDPEQTEGSHISLILNFNDESILNELTNQANRISNRKKPKHYNTQITIMASKKVVNVSFTSYHIPRNKDIKLVLMFDSDINDENKEPSVDELIEKNKDIKIQCIPENLRDKIDVNSNENNKFISHYLVFIAIEILNINEYGENHSAKETLKFFKNFESKINEMSNSKDRDSICLKKIGNIFIIGFNFIQQITNFYQSTQNACTFMKEINSFAISNNYVIRSCMTSAKSATSLLISKNTLKFDVYSNKIKAMMSLLKSAQKYEVIIQPKMKDFISPDIESEIEEVEITQYNSDSEWGYKINYAK